MHSKQYVRLMNDKRWRALRNAWLSEHPLCAEHYKQGKVVPASCVHHITPIESAKSDRQMEALAYSQTNLMSLCYECHAKIHKAERSHSREEHQRREGERLERFKGRLGGH